MDINMDTVMIRKNVNDLINDSRLAENNDLSILLFFTALCKEEVLDDTIFLEFNDVVSGINILVSKIRKESTRRILLDALEIYTPEINFTSNNMLLIMWRRIKKLIIISDAKTLFEEVINQISQASRSYDGLSLSSDLAAFINNLSRIEEGNSIYNPFAGYASLALNTPKKCSYFGEELNRTTAVIANLRLLVHDKTDTSYVKNIDSFNRFSGALDTISKSMDITKVDYSLEKSKKFDVATAMPPFNLKDAKGKSANTIILKSGVDLLNDTGRLVYLLSYVAIGEKNCNQLLTELCKQNILEGIISLPVGTFPKIGIKSCVIVINKNKTENGNVRLVDANVFTNAERGNNEFLKFAETLIAYYDNANINGAISLTNKTLLSIGSFYPENLIYQILTPQVKNGVELRNLVLSEKSFSRTLNEENLNLPRIKSSDLNNNIKLDYRNINRAEVKRNDLILKDSCFLLGTFNGQLKFSYFEHKDDIYCCSSNMIPIKIDETRVSIPYFAKQLTEIYFQDQFKSTIKGSSIQMVSKNDLLKLIISIPSLKEQERQVESLLNYFNEADRNLQLMASLEDQLFEQTVYLRHAIAGPARNILSFFNKMMQIVEANRNLKVSEIVTAKLKPADRYCFKDMREIVERDLLKVGDILKNQLDVQEKISSSKLELMDIDSFLSEYTHNLEQVHPLITINYESFVPYLLDDIDKAEYVTILGNRDLLRTMLDNLFENAVKHAFQETSEKKFLVNLNYDEDSGVLSIEVANSGKGFPKDINFKGFISKNKKSNESLGDGFGGWYINQVIKHHNGKLEIDDNSTFKPEIADGYATSFHIFLPLAQD